MIDNTTKTATGVEFVRNNKLTLVRATKEVILSAGTVATPHILLLSGVGPRQQLEQFKVRTIH